MRIKSHTRGKMLRSHRVVLGLATALSIAAGLAWAGGEVWKTKPYTQWTENDIREILTHSPWVRADDVLTSWKPNSYSPGVSQPGQAGASSPQARPGMGQPGQTGESGQAQSPEGAGQVGEQGLGADTTFYVRWVSAKVIREAFVRNAVLQGSLTSAQATTELAKPVSDYLIALSGRDMTPFSKVSEQDLKTASYIEDKQSKQKIAPSSVTIQKRSDGSVEGVLFSFPRKTADGRDVITSTDKSVQFQCKLKNVDVKTSFDPRKMTGPNGLDL